MSFLFKRILFLIFDIFLLVFLALVVLTLLSRFGYLDLVGLSIVASNSMEPSLRVGDLVLYSCGNYSVGDVILYCVTPSHCIVHRIIDLVRVNMSNGDRIMLITKGDNANQTDSPIELSMVRGRVILSIPREIWIPLLVAVIVYSLYGIARIPVIGFSYVISLALAIILLLSVYIAVPGAIALSPSQLPLVDLAGVYLDQASCSLSIRYTTALSIANASVGINSTQADIVSILDREIIVKPDPMLLKKAFEERKPLHIEVRAVFNGNIKLEGGYDLLVGGVDPEISSEDGVILVRNLNCFPITVNISIRYYLDGAWIWSNESLTIEGFSQALIQLPEKAEYAYAYISWFNQGVLRWIGIPVRIG